jgi:phosphotriesterase-related protein
MIDAALPQWEPTHLFKRIIPELKSRGVTDDDLRVIFVENPKRYFAGVEAPR